MGQTETHSDAEFTGRGREYQERPDGLSRVRAETVTLETGFFGRTHGCSVPAARREHIQLWSMKVDGVVCIYEFPQLS